MKALKKPQAKKFSSRKYNKLISKLRKNTPGRVIEKSGERVAIVLRNYEGFFIMGSAMKGNVPSGYHFSIAISS